MVPTSLIMLMVSLFAFADYASKEQRGIVKCGVTGLKTLSSCCMHAACHSLLFSRGQCIGSRSFIQVCPKCIEASNFNQGPFDTLRYSACSIQSYNTATKRYMNKF